MNIRPRRVPPKRVPLPLLEEQRDQAAAALKGAAESLSNTMEAQQEAIRGLPLYPGATQPPHLSCLVEVDGKQAAFVADVPDLSWALDLFHGVCIRNQGAKCISLELLQKQ